MTFDYFFTPEPALTADMGISAWGPVHIGWLIAMAIFCTVACVRYRRLSPEKRAKMLKILASIIIGIEIVKDILHICVGDMAADHLPFHLCGVSIFICAFVAFGRFPLARQMLYALSLPGALAALVFLNWVHFPALHFQSIVSFAIHGCLVTFSLLPLIAGEFRPDWRQLPKIFGMLAVFAALVYPANKWLGTNWLFLNVPSPGSPLMPLADWLGNPGYILGVVGLLLAVWLVSYTPWVIAGHFGKKRGRRHES
jgi:hypothetical integral membrane protein (TIGR02206 family)